MLFINNKYSTWYFNIIDVAKSRILNPDVYHEVHHIIPKSLNGSNDRDNLVSLTGREHLLCHRLLIRMTEGTNKAKMVSAAWTMANLNNDNQQRSRLTSRQYSYLREQFSKVHSVRMSENNPMHDPIVRAKYDAAIIKRGKTKGMSGKIHSEETKAKMSVSSKGQIVPLEKRLAASKFHSNRPDHMKEMYKQIHSNKICCLTCKTEYLLQHYSRWHGEKCHPRKRRSA